MGRPQRSEIDNGCAVQICEFYYIGGAAIECGARSIEDCSLYLVF